MFVLLLLFWFYFSIHFLFFPFNFVFHDYAVMMIGFSFTAKVRGLEFNTLNPNLLASGTEEGDICIWDISKPSEPSHFPPLKVCYKLQLVFVELLI